jgi:hypothetical protein
LQGLDLLVSTAADCSAKVLDPVLGQIMFVIPNRNKCCFTGLCPAVTDTLLLMTDELG